MLDLLPTLLDSLSFVLSLFVWLLFGLFGVWLYRRFRAPTLPWLGLFWLITSPLLVHLNRWVANSQSGVQSSLKAVLGPAAAVPSWMGVLQLLNVGAYLLITVVLMAEMVWIFEKLGVKPDNIGQLALFHLSKIGFALTLLATLLSLCGQILWLLIF